MFDKEFLFKLLDSFGPSGFEERALSLFVERMEKYNFEVELNSYNSCVSTFNRHAEKKVLIVGHIDEIGFIVSSITESGFLKVKTLGGIDPYILLGSKVKILNNKDKFVKGIFGSTAIHLLEERDRNIKLKNLYIDIGAKDKKDVEENFNVEVGSPIIFNDKRVSLGNNLVATKAADDRLGVFVASQVAINCKEEQTAVIAAATCQEENGLIGAQMLSSLLKETFGLPDYNIVVDVTHGIDYPGSSPEEHGDIKLGGGPVLSYGSVNNKELVNKLKSLAKENNIPCQIDVSPRYSGTDADILHIMRGGTIPTVIVSIPLRYMHTQSEVFCMDDVKATVNLLTAFVNSIK